MAQTVKNSPAIRAIGLIPGLGRSPREGNGNLLWYACLENPHGQRSLVDYSPWGHTELDRTERLKHIHARTSLDVFNPFKVTLTISGFQFWPTGRDYPS